MIKYKSVIVWTLMLMALAGLWVSLRSTSQQMEYTLLAIGIWGISFVVNRYWK